MIRFHGVSKYFDDKVAVDGLDLEIQAGSIFGLIGPNGAGKTTTLKMLATLIKPDRGRITLEGADLDDDIPKVRRRIGFMPDAFGIFRGLSCAEHLQFFGRAYGLWGRDLERRVEDVLRLTDLTALEDELTGALSTGMRQRLSLAKTLLHDPAILVLDEPASGLDPRARIEIRTLLKELGAMGKTILISSHILSDLEEICTDIGIVEAGKLVWQGALQSVLEAGGGRGLAVAVQVPEGQAERALEVIGRLDFARAASARGGRIEAQVSGSKTNELLEALILAGIEIRSFSREAADLEALFLKITKGVVS
ncbi:MAG: ABC transporter ATP-binding protein [Planctomycetes bacterium]|nr:ABC transporter ATP-binding protein [Planctomycetota bacterium]